MKKASCTITVNIFKAWQAQRAHVQELGLFPRSQKKPWAEGGMRLKAWSSSCLVIKVKALWRSSVSLSDLDSVVPWPDVLHSSFCDSFLYTLSSLHLFLVKFTVVFLPSSPPFPVFLPLLTNNFLQVSLFFPCKLTSLCLLSTISSRYSPCSCLCSLFRLP